MNTLPDLSQLTYEQLLERGGSGNLNNTYK